MELWEKTFNHLVKEHDMEEGWLMIGEAAIQYHTTLHRQGENKHSHDDLRQL